MFKYISFLIVVGALVAIAYSVWFKKQSPPTPSPSATTQSSITTIKIENNRFIPTSVSVKVGQSVSFVNNDSTDHQLASDPHPTHTGYPPLNAGILSPDGVAQSVTFTKKGVFGFHDHLNPTIKGQIVVE